METVGTGIAADLMQSFDQYNQGIDCMPAQIKLGAYNEFALVLVDRGLVNDRRI